MESSKLQRLNMLTEQVCSDLWSHLLQQDIIDLILERLGVLDRIRFGAVCASWRAGVARSTATSVLEFPLLWYAASDPPDSRASPYCNDDYLVSSLVEDRYYTINPFCTKGSEIVGIIEGRWWIMVKYSGWDPSFDGESQMEKTTHHFILNPVTGKQFMLPPQSTISGTHGQHPHFFRKKMVGSSEPTNPNCLVAGKPSRSSCLAFCRLTDKKWTLLNLGDEVDYLMPMEITFCGGKLYVISTIEEFVIEFDLREENKSGIYKAQKIVMKRPTEDPYIIEVPQLAMVRRAYLTFSDSVSGELLLVRCESKLVLSKEDLGLNEGFQVVSLRVFKMNIVNNHNRWEEVTDLGDRLLFCGNDGANFLIPSKALGESTQKNCIYYAFQRLDSFEEVGKFCLDDQTFIQFSPKSNFPKNKRFASGWFVPTLI